ncbi:CHASE3 domain-containing protein [Bernardetia sp. ABR2-2B]|uniref:sensor histidine kinase n=1 Tax=Bernardetia sp. ABR2-2B TaxID=3127472 RepID=UPI0030D12677
MSFRRPQKDKLTYQRRVESRKVIRTLSIGLGLILILLVGYFVSQKIENNIQQELREILLLEGELGDLLSSVQDAETGQRGFLLTSNEEYLKYYYIALEKTPQLIKEIEEYPNSDTVFKEKLYLIKELIDEKFEELKMTIDYKNNNEAAKALELVNSDIGKDLMDKIRIRIRELRKTSYQSLEESREEILIINKVVVTFQLIASIAMLFIFYNIYSILRPLIDNLVESNNELERRREILKEKNEQLERFAYIASHDLNEPLRTITSIINILEEDYGDKFDKEAKQNFTFITSAAKRMKKMIDGILNYSRIGKSSEVEEIELNALLYNLQKDLSLLIEKKQATISFDKLPIIKGFKLELRQLFQNLLTNALKFSKEGVAPIIEITVEEQPQSWKFLVKDNGIGIPEEHKKKIFGIFAKLHRNSKYEGQGIGLAFCKKIVSLHKGKIGVESEFGIGTIFYFTISKNINQNNHEI